jgi:hypothetical protein
MSDELAIRPDISPVAIFELDQRDAMALSKSKFIPDYFQDNIADCIRIVQAARAMRSTPVEVAKSIYFVHGKPGWHVKFLISCINSNPEFSQDLDYEMSGEGDERKCRAWTVSKKTGQKLFGPEITIAAAKMKGWFTRNDSWKAFPELMLQYRAATFFANTRCPGMVQGFPTREELEDMRQADARVVTKPNFEETE